MRNVARIALVLIACSGVRAEEPWRTLPLIKGGQVDPNWAQTGWGGFTVIDDTLRSVADERGMGLLLYKAEKFGNCQIRIVYKCQEAKSNSGVFVRIGDGVLDQVGKKPAAAQRTKNGELSEAELKKFMDASERDEGPWYAVHHGYEVQICDASDELHRTGAIYSLAKAAPAPKKAPTEWKTMVITLKGNRVLVDIDGTRVTDFDPESKDVPRERKWYEPKREPKRPETGYIGLQNHDGPTDVVFFKEVSVRPLGERP